ncbi:Uncharacterised protein [Mycobacteroides abscessus]|nr:Uncharacterised protein [Mycobacteroides abscessus]SKY57368.1 Uncharacterised protein [Mycobacteroides abscessus subsp. abscessus]
MGGINTPHGQFGAGQHQAQHEGLVVNSGDQVHQEQRIGGSEPERADLRHAAALGQARRGPDDQQHAEKFDQPMAERPGDDVIAGKPRDALTDPQEQRTIRGRCFSPQTRHREREHVVQPEGGCRALGVRILAESRYLALCQIRVDVLGVHRRRDEQRQEPQQQGPVQLAPGHPAHRTSGPIRATVRTFVAQAADREAAQHQPGERHHHRAGGCHGQGHRLDSRRQIE